MFHIRLFGPGQAKYDGHYLSGFPHQRAALLLCFLLLNRKYPHHRERLAATFWGDFSSQSARKQLRNALWGLRQMLQSAGAPPDQFLSADEEYISFDPYEAAWLDTEQFEQSIQACQGVAGQALNVEQAGQLEEAANLYTGDLLEGVYEDWCLYDRERLRLIYQTTLNKLLVYHAIHSAYGPALSFGQRLLDLDHTLEAVHRQVMCLYWLSGDRAAAFSQYKLCCQIMRDEFDAAPMEETRSLYEQLRSARPPSASWILAVYFQFSMQPAGLPAEPLPIEQLLRQIAHLQNTIDSTSAELHQIERLLSQALGNP